LLKLDRSSGWSVTLYDNLDGLPSNEILGIAADYNSVFLSTSEGICSFPTNASLSNSSLPPISLNMAKVNRKVMKWDDDKKYTFAHDENSFNFSFDVLSYKNSDQPKLFFEMQGLGNAPRFFQGRELSFDNLPPGDYKLTVFGVNNNGLLSRTPLEFRFNILQPYWRTAWFILLCVIGALGLILVSVMLLVKNIRKKEENKTRVNKLIAQYQLSALRAQMNPHFIFNCINSIQRYIITNKAEEAYKYLSSFSKLIRHVLNLAEKDFVSLAQELEVVELYLELEQIRFENRFTYEVEGLSDIDPEKVFVPAMILQPYIENAIWHGLMNLGKEKKGHIRIGIKQEEALLKILIEDNGIGREKAQAFSKKEHTSKALGINSKRAEMLNILGNEHVKGGIRIEDIVLEDGSSGGTRVIIEIPQNPLDHE
jgi:hypothetical protein